MSPAWRTLCLTVAILSSATGTRQDLQQTAALESGLAGTALTVAGEPRKTTTSGRRRTKVWLTTSWVPPVMDLTRAFKTTWRAIPVSLEKEFHITGYAWNIWRLLRKRPNLPVVCDEALAGQPVWLVVNTIMKSAAEYLRRAFAGGFGHVAGIVGLFAQMTVVFGGGGEAMIPIATLISNPSTMKPDMLLDRLIAKVDLTPAKTIKMLWGRLWRVRNTAFLTFGDPAKKRHAGGTVKFMCVEGEYPNSTAKAFVSFIDNRTDGNFTATPLTAKSLGLLIAALS